IVGTVLAYVFGVLETTKPSIQMNMNDMLSMPSFSAVGDLEFWLAVFPLTIILVFENMGLLHGQLQMLNQQNSYNKAYRTTAFSSLMSAFSATSPTGCAAAKAAVITSGEETGKAAMTAGLLSLATLRVSPWIAMTPSS